MLKTYLLRTCYYVTYPVYCNTKDYPTFYKLIYTLNPTKMKKMTSIKSILVLSVALFATSFSFTACETKKKEDTKEVAEELNEPKKDATSEVDERFLVNAAEINLEDIQLGKLAQQKGMTADVKALGKMMEDAHTKAMGELSALASQKSIAIPKSPTENALDAYKKLNEKSGVDFDKEYCDMMVRGHKDAIDKFEKASNDCKDADIKGWAANTLLGLRMHLAHAETCQNKLK